MGIGVDKKGISLNKDNCILKRKRLDARSFREWHISLAKKQNTPTCKETSPDRSDTVLHVGGDRLEASSLKERIGITKIRHSHCEKERTDLEVKSPPEKTEVINKEYGVSLQVHSSNREKRGSDGSPRFVEYWVPVGFSCLQLEKYCETFIKNAALLCSSKKGNMDALHDVLSVIRMCCDHPYLVDRSLEKFANEGRPTIDKLSIGIEVSGKLLLLDKFLQEVKGKQLRVVIVFQSNNSNSLRYILDDFVCRRFGEDSYVHIYQEFSNTKKRAALDIFNDKSSGRFVVLIEKSSCQPSVRLSSVDFVILFNCDWSPVNDMKALRKMSIQGQLDHVKVLRLYSANSVEEKVLSFAKEGILLDSSISYFSHNISQMMLLWGASHLFAKLSDFHSHSSFDNLNSSVEQKLLDDVLLELSGLLSSEEGDSDSCSCISKVPETSDISDIPLYGVQDAPCIDDDIPHSALWISLLEGMNPHWKLLRGSSMRVKRRGDCGNKNHIVMNKNMVHSVGESLSLKPKVRKARTPSSRRKSSKLAGQQKYDGNGVFVWRESSGSCHREEETCNKRMKELLLKHEMEIHKFYRIKRSKRAKLDEEHQLELVLVNQKFEETAIKQQEIKKLDDIYKRKIEKLDCEMDMKRKKLEDFQLAARKKEKQLNDRLLASSTRMDFCCPISAPSYTSLLKSEWKRRTVEVLKRSDSSPRPISNSLCLPESQCCEGIGQDVVGGSCNCDSGLPPNQFLVETEIVSGESNRENESNGEHDAALIAKADVPNTAPHNVSVLVTENSVSQPTSIDGKLCQNVLHMSDLETQGVSSTNMEPSDETLRGVSVHHNTHLSGSLRHSVESKGENSVMVSSEKVPDSIKPLNGALNWCTSVEHQQCTLNGEKNGRPSSNVSHMELLDNDQSVVLVGMSNRKIGSGVVDLDAVSNRETESRGVELDAASAARLPRIKHVTDTPAARLASSSSVLMPPDPCKSANLSRYEQGMAAKDQPPNESKQCALSGQKCWKSSLGTNRELQHGGNELEPHIGRCNEETEGRCSTDMGTITDIARQRTVEDSGDLPSSRFSASSCVLMRPQASAITGNSSSLEQPLSTTVVPTHEIRRNDNPVVVPRGQTVPLRQLSVAYDMHPDSNLTGAPILLPTNSYSQETPSFRSDVPASTGFDPLQNELLILQKEEAAAIQVHTDKVKLFKFACEKEMEEIQKKYDLLVQEVKITLLQKKEDLGSYFRKVCANKILAETMILFNDQAILGRTQEHPFTAAQQLSVLQHLMPDPRFSQRSEFTAPRQVVHQLSELVPTVPLITADYHTWAPTQPPLYNPVSSLPMSRNTSSFCGVQNLEAVLPDGSFPRSYPIDHNSGPMMEHEGCQQSFILL